MDCVEAQPGKCLPVDFALGLSSFLSVNWNSSDANFKFVAGDDRVLWVHPMLAEFISPKVSRIRRSDVLSDQYIFEDKASCVGDALFALVSHIRDGQSLQVTASNLEGLTRLAYELDNSEILGLMLSLADIDIVTATSILKVKSLASRCEHLVEFVASHFYSLSQALLSEMDIDTATLHLSHPSLKVQDEDSVYDFVKGRAQNDVHFVSLFEFVRYENLSVDRVTEFVSLFGRHCLGEINTSIWASVGRRLILVPKATDSSRVCGSSASRKEQGQASERKFVYKKKKPLDGIISHLTKECGSNVHAAGLVDVSASSVDGNDCEPRNIADLNSPAIFWSKDESNSWIRYDFKTMTVRPTSYSIKSYGAWLGWNHLKSWVLEGSANGNEWQTLDRRDDTYDLNAKTPTPHKTSQFLAHRLAVSATCVSA